MNCVRCAYDNPPGAAECAACGVIFGKARVAAPPRRFAKKPFAVELETISDGRIGRDELRILGIGLAMAIVVYALRFTRFVFSAIVTLFHELGHAVAGWLTGHVSLPAFDLVYGGGLTSRGPFRLSIAIAVGAGFAYLIYLLRENRKAMIVAGAVALLWLFLVSAEWRRELFIGSAGHLSEFILAGILFYKALSGSGWKAPEYERPLGAFVAFFVQIHSSLFALRLLRDQDFLAWYREGKGGMLMNDLESIALDLHIHTPFNPGIDGVCRLLLMFSLLPIAVGIVWHLQRTRWHRVMRALREIEN